MPPRGVSKLIAGADGLGFSATDGGLRPPPPPISVEPSGIPTGPTDEPAPIDEANGGDAVADAAQVPGAIALMPPPSKSAVPDNPVMELPVAASAPVVGLPAPAPVIALAMASDAGAGEAPAHVAPINGEPPNVVGLTPGVASSVAPMGTPVCPTGAFGTPRGDVMPSAGSGDTFMRACAWTEPQPKRTATVAPAKRVSIGFDLILTRRWRRAACHTSSKKCNPTVRTPLCVDCCALLDPASRQVNRRPHSSPFSFEQERASDGKLRQAMLDDASECEPLAFPAIPRLRDRHSCCAAPVSPSFF